MTAIAVLDEPFESKPSLTGTAPLHKQAAFQLVQQISSNFAVMVPDAFGSPADRKAFMSEASQRRSILLDTRHYQVFTDAQLRSDPADRIAQTCSFGTALRDADDAAIVGQWSGALTDCGLFLNGVGKGSRYDGTLGDAQAVGSCAGQAYGSAGALPAAAMAAMAKYVEVQMEAFEAGGAGWIFRTWKTQLRQPGWDLRDMLENGVFPRPGAGRRGPGLCASQPSQPSPPSSSQLKARAEPVPKDDPNLSDRKLPAVVAANPNADPSPESDDFDLGAGGPDLTLARSRYTQSQVCECVSQALHCRASSDISDSTPSVTISKLRSMACERSRCDPIERNGYLARCNVNLQISYAFNSYYYYHRTCRFHFDGSRVSFFERRVVVSDFCSEMLGLNRNA